MKKEILFNENEYVLYRVLECLYNCMYGSLSKNVNTKVETLLKELIEIFDQENPKKENFFLKCNKMTLKKTYKNITLIIPKKRKV